MAKIS